MRKTFAWLITAMAIGAGSVVATPASAQTETVLFNFNVPATTGERPDGSLFFDHAGNLYGATQYTNYKNLHGGTVFKLTPPATGTNWSETVLHTFNGAADGLEPSVGIFPAANGDLYGTATFGGDKTKSECIFDLYGCGAVFAMTPPPTAHPTRHWGLAVLYDFFNGPSNGPDGLLPIGGRLVADSSGALYGTTAQGGVSPHGGYGGTVFKLTPPSVKGQPWTETVLYTFCSQPNCADGDLANGDLVADASGALYGTTAGGGNPNCTIQYQGCGVVFKLTPGAGGTWTESTLYAFTGTGGDGIYPIGSLAVDKTTGTVYGATAEGGDTSCSNLGLVPGCGIVFAIPSSGGSDSMLHAFTGAASINTDGNLPEGGVIEDASGNLYGTTFQGGCGPCAQGGAGGGVVFKLAPAGGGAFTESVLYSFLGTEAPSGDGVLPVGGLTMDSNGNLYGTTESGGSGGYGTVFEITQ